MDQSRDCLKPFLDSLRAALMKKGWPETEINIFIQEVTTNSEHLIESPGSATLDAPLAKETEAEKAE